MSGKKTTAREMIDGITGGTAKMFDVELKRQQQALEKVFNLKSVGDNLNKVREKVEDTYKSAVEVADTVLDKKGKFKKNILQRFADWVPEFVKKKAKDLEPVFKVVKGWVDASGKALGKRLDTVVNAITKTFNARIVKPILSPLAKGFASVLKYLDTQLNRLISGPLKFVTDRINGIVKPLSNFLPGASKLVNGLVPFVKLFGKILPFVGLVFDYLSAQAQTQVLEVQSRQIGKLYDMFGDLRTKQASQTATINRILSVVGSGSRAGAGLTEADRQAITNAVIAGLRPVISGNKPDLSGVNGQLSKISGQVAAIQPAKPPDFSAVTAQILKVGAQVAAIKPTVDLSGVNSQLTQLKGQIAAIPAAIPKPTVDLSSLTAEIRAVGNKVSAIPAPKIDFTPVNDRLTQISGQVTAISVPKVDLSGVMSKLGQIDNNVSRIPTSTVDISGVNRQLANIASAQNAISAAALSAAVVTSLRPLIQQNTAGISEVNANVARVDAKLRSPLMAIDPEVRAAAARIEQRVTASGQVINAVDDKLGAKVTGGLSGKLARIGKIMQFDRIINLLTLITVLHNASMLASSLGQTLGALTSEALAVIGIKDEEGSAIDINGILSKQADAFIISIIGQEAWNGVKTNWNKANRVISSASNVIWTVRSMADSTRNVLEWSAENTGKIGNALKKARVVPENSYPWMAEQVNAQSRWHRTVDKFSQGIGQIDETASSLASVVGDVRSVQSEFTELKTQKDEFKAALAAAAPKPGVDNTPIKTESAAVTAVSKVAPEIAKPDREEGKDATP